jgi:monofunctional biosynthetic peptidoglycan transglycosylase
MFRAKSPTGASRSGSRRLRRILLALAALFVGVPFLLILVFRILPPPVTPLMLIRAVQGHGLHRQWTSYHFIAPSLAEAVIASEDNLFCEERLGFDLQAIRGEADAWMDGERPRGASTITMQTAKNLFLWPGRDPVRKLLEAWLTPQLALLWPKRRVVEVYLNIVEFGPGVYGAEAAARTYFRKSAADLSAREAALLAGVLPQPLARSASSPTPFLRERAAVIERRVGQIRPLLACLR